MNPEALRAIPKRLITNPETLGRVCWNLANQLTDKRWILDEVRDTDYLRRLREQIGFEVPLGDKEIQPTKNEVYAAFFATKQIVEGYRGNPADIDTYRLVMSIGQSIDESDVPPHVIDEIFALKASYERSDDDDDEDDDDDDDAFETVLDIVDRDNLDQFEITREQEIVYEITGGGDIETYDLTYTYLIDKESVHEIHYSSEEGTRITAPITISSTGEEVDRRPAILLYLSDSQLETEVEEMDESWFQFIQERTMIEIASFGGQDQLDHRRQALAIIGLLGSGLFSLKDLASNK
ncbi:MAG TPA: hypothetical protein VIM31_02095 [Candidatus Microsaccharimonas sp.]|jgi:hypothetical protein